MKIWVTSDSHFGHDREFIWKPRGFQSVDEMNEAIVNRWNSVVDKDDIVYHLGDVLLGDVEKNISFLKRLNGKIIIIAGNHDTDSRIDLYTKEGYKVLWAQKLKYQGYSFFLTHFPSLTSNLQKESLKQCTCNLFGHTHQTTNFYQDIPFMYHVGMDSHNCYPVLLDNIIEEMQNKVKECRKFLD